MTEYDRNKAEYGGVRWNTAGIRRDVAEYGRNKAEYPQI
jgi:hypothetical protein